MEQNSTNAVMSYPFLDNMVYDNDLLMKQETSPSSTTEVQQYLQRISHLEDQLLRANNRIQILQTQISKKGSESKLNKVK